MIQSNYQEGGEAPTTTEKEPTMLERITATTREDQAAHYSTDLTGGQPVILDGGTTAYATGYEQGSAYELRLHSTFGPLTYVTTVRPSTEETLHRDLAETRLNGLDAALTTLGKTTTDPRAREIYLRMRTELAAIGEGLTTGQYGDA